ncbi:MAG: DUF4179 domain-containing protein [Clostridium sp.]|uniref:DUF4179 domain-containing protein n=1 Tax=Clostridium sp. TaxID=1506 RepID=UPI002FC86F8D
MNDDKLISDMLKSNDDLVVPSEISKGIDETLLSLKDKQCSNKSNKTKKPILKCGGIAAGIAVTLLITLGSLFPGFADEIPIINKILGSESIFNKESNDNLIAVQNCSISVNETKGGITVKELGYDGAAFYLVYETKGDNGFGDPKIIVNGQEFTPGYFPEDDNKSIHTLVYPIPVDSKFQDKFCANIIFEKAKDKSRSIVFQVNLDKKTLIGEGKNKDISKVINKGKLNMEITSVNQSNSYVTVGTIYDEYYPDEFNIVVYDDKGNPLDQLDMGRLEKKNGKTYVTRVFKAYSSTNISKIEVVRKTLVNFTGYIPRVKREIKLTEATPITVNYSKGRSLTINKIIKTKYGYEVIVRFNNVPGIEFIYSGGGAGEIMIRDNNKPDKEYSSYDTPSRDMLSDGSYKLTFGSEYDTEKFDFTNSSLIVGSPDNSIKVIQEIKLTR